MFVCCCVLNTVVLGSCEMLVIMQQSETSMNITGMKRTYPWARCWVWSIAKGSRTPALGMLRMENEWLCRRASTALNKSRKVNWHGLTTSPEISSRYWLGGVPSGIGVGGGTE